MLKKNIFASYTKKSITFNGIEYFESISVDRNDNVSVWNVENRISLKAVDDVSIQIQTGESFGLVGESGSSLKTNSIPVPRTRILTLFLPVTVI